jgi:hypothetical protein
MRKRFFGRLSLILAVASSMPAFAEPEVTVASGKQCNPGLHRQPDGPFAVMLFCDDALGSNLGVVYYGHLGAPTDGKWALTDRFWQDSNWGADVTAFAWDPKRELLLVSTSAIYGTGTVYRLELKNRRYARLFPLEKDKQWLPPVREICLTEIAGLDSKRRELTLKIDSWVDGDCDPSTTRTIAVGY